MSNYDVIYVGAGTNALSSALYLADAGLKVGMFEARGVVGGCAVTEEPWEGYKVSSLSYVNSLFNPEIVKKFDLHKYGYEMIPRDPSSFTPFLNGRSLILGPDREMTIKQIEKFSKKDAASYVRYEDHLTGIAELLEPIMTMTPPNMSNITLSDFLTYGKFGLKNRKKIKERWSDIVKIMTGCASDMLNDWFESEELKVTLSTDAIIGANVSPTTPGTAYILFHHVMGECNGVRGVWGYMRGGMGKLSESLADACRDLGVDIFLNSPISRIAVRETSNGNKVRGIIVGDEFHHSDIVVSGVDPNITFNKLIGEDLLPRDFVKKVNGISYDSASMKINLALSELPDFTCLRGEGIHHRGTIHICPTLRYLEEAYADSLLGRPSKNPILECTIPSTVDNTVAPEGKHIMNIFVQYAPYNLFESDWDTEREIFGNRCIDVLNEYAPNFKASVIHKQFITPLDLEREYHLTGGNIFHGRMSLDQMFNMRPVPGYANYRTPVKGLYMCGAGTHPGGGVMGTSGMNASREILKDL